jgi:transmembrane sensor
MDRQTLVVTDDAFALQAAEWLLELQRRDIDVERILAWQAWMTADPRHKDAFDRLQEVQECVDRIESPPWPTDFEVATDQGGASHGDYVRDSDAGTTRVRAEQSRRSFTRITALAASVVIAVAAMFALPRVGIDIPLLAQLTNPPIQTNIGELRRVQLSDGSTITLGGLSRVSVHIDEQIRRIVLARGEAFFEVAKDPQRPFVVEVDDTVVRAVGTAFDVRRAGSKVSVSVAEGVVEVIDAQARSGSNAIEAIAPIATRLSAGQSIQFEPSRMQPPPPIVIDADAVAAWRNGQRQYLGEPLANVIADLNRYSTRKITIEDPALRDMAITGSIFERDIERWVKSLEVALPVEVEQDGDRIIIRSRD